MFTSFVQVNRFYYYCFNSMFFYQITVFFSLLRVDLAIFERFIKKKHKKKSFCDEISHPSHNGGLLCLRAEQTTRELNDVTIHVIARDQWATRWTSRDFTYKRCSAAEFRLFSKKLREALRWMWTFAHFVRKPENNQNCRKSDRRDAAQQPY